MAGLIGLIVSVVALCVSVFTAWLTLLRRGKIRMTQPTVIYFGPDGGGEPDRQRSNKVFLRALLYSTAARGQIIESMYLRLRRGETTQNFNIWVYGEGQANQRGSGLFVPQAGVSTNHHFLLPRDGAQFEFAVGHYFLEVFAVLAGSETPKSLFSTQLELDREIVQQLESPEHGIYFDWGPDARRYDPHVRRNLKPELKELVEEYRAFMRKATERSVEA